MDTSFCQDYVLIKLPTIPVPALLMGKVFFLMFSVIQTVIENGLDPYKYLTWLMKTAKDTNLTDEKTIQMLLWNAPAECRRK